ncbi:phospholipase A1-like [Periplaneta americana]|uniref:phospholipase A1-like n=1 Tax=Periplaneta americana TaxID=6978 RepID=UPI0037E97CAA
MLGSVVLTVLLAGAHASGAAAQSREVCCGDLGCFSPIATGRRIFTTPKCPPDLSVTFYFYRRSESSKPYLTVRWPDIKLDESQLDVSKPIMIFIHDHAGSANCSLVQNLTDAYLKKVDSTVIIVDYDSSGSYQQSVANSRVVAAQISRFIQNLTSNLNAMPDVFHLIGFGIGAQIAGYTGRAVPGIGRFTGLDPAGPLFNDHTSFKGDAQFVEIVHTNCDPSSGIGTCNDGGDVDFYFNGGLTQPCCPVPFRGNQITELAFDNFSAFYDKVSPINITCSHIHAMKYYTDSLINDNCTYWGKKRNIIREFINIITNGFASKFVTSLRKCTLSTCSPFGLETNQYPARGSFDVATSDDEPYCIPHYVTDIDMLRQLAAQNQNPVPENKKATEISYQPTSISENFVETTTQTT